MPTRPLAALVVLLALVAAPARAAAQTGENVAVVINETSAVSQRVGEYYARKRALPPQNVIRIKTATTDEVTRPLYVGTIEGPIAAALAKNSLQDRILFIVLTKDVPLRIAGTVGPEGTVSSVDSELTLLYRKMTGRPVAAIGRVDNPYFLGAADVRTARPFTHERQDIYLVTRLDGFTAEDAIALVDRAAAAVNNGTFVLDGKGAIVNRTGDDWLEAAGDRLKGMGLTDRLVVDGNTGPVRDVKNVLGYYSWGSNDPANRVRHFGMSFVPGAITGTFVSSDARTFKEPPADWQPLSNWNDPKTFFGGSPQSLAGDLIHDGATGAAGHVAEPYLESTVRPQVLFPAYVSGFTLAESYYLAIPHLSWQTVVIGDPLCRPFTRTALTRAEIEAPIDDRTELPGYFSNKRLDVARVQLGTDDVATAARFLRAETRVQKGDLPGAKKAYQETVEASPQLAAAQFQLAMIEQTDGQIDLAIERYKKVVGLQPRNVIALNNLAYALAVDRKDPVSARPYADRAAALAPQDPSVLDTLAWVQHLQGENEAAAKTIAAAATRGPNNAELHLHAAFIYDALGGSAPALSELNRAVTLDASVGDRQEVKDLRRKLEGKGPHAKSLPQK